jgi:hypothetical protein
MVIGIIVKRESYADSHRAISLANAFANGTPIGLPEAYQYCRKVKGIVFFRDGKLASVKIYPADLGNLNPDTFE